MNIAVIPARSGSKGIPNKNIIDFMGKPLIYWSILSAKSSKCIDRVFVSTDSKEIAILAENFGAEVLNRPESLSQDDTKTIEVLKYHSQFLNEYENFFVLQPTSPLRKKNLIDDCYKSYVQSESSNLATGYRCKQIEFGTHLNERRQEIKGFFYDDGSLYILPKRLVDVGSWNGSNPKLYINEKQFTYEIDDKIDLTILKHLFKNYQNDV